MKTTQLTQALNAFELSGSLIHGRTIEGCHFEINPDGGGCLQIRPECELDEATARSPICSIELEFKNDEELAQLCESMTTDPQAICKRAERRVHDEIERIAEEATN